MVRGYVAGANRWLQDNKVTDPACKGDAYSPTRPRGWARSPSSTSGTASTSPTCWRRRGSSSRRSSTRRRRRRPGPPGRPARCSPPTSSTPRPSGSRSSRARPDPARPFGSNATAVGGDRTTTGRGMILGNPHFPWRGRYHFTQQHLTIPGKYDVAGASLVGSPVVNIGWNKRVSWSHSRLHGLPLHAVRVPHGRADELPDGLRAAGPRAPAGEGQGAQGRRQHRHRRRGPVADQGGVRRGVPGHADVLDARQRLGPPGRQRRAPADHRHVPRDGQGPRRPRPAAAPGQGRRHAVGQHHRGRPQRRRPLRGPLRGAQRLQRARPAVHDARRPGAERARRAARPRRHPGAVVLRVGHRPGRVPARDLRSHATCPRSSAATT